MQTDATTLAAMLRMMRQQRDEFRKPRSESNLGSAHSDETRRVCAELLDWYIMSYGMKDNL